MEGEVTRRLQTAPRRPKNGMPPTGGIRRLNNQESARREYASRFQRKCPRIWHVFERVGQVHGVECRVRVLLRGQISRAHLEIAAPRGFDSLRVEIQAFNGPP